MGRERQKKKNRSSVSKVKPTLRGRTKYGKKKVNFLGNAVVAENWDRDLTLLQNYKRLGLTSRLCAVTGGMEKKISHDEPNSSQSGSGAHVDVLVMPSSKRITTLLPTEARVERDPETGRILRVIHPDGANGKQDVQRRRRRLDDPLNSDEEEEEEGADAPELWTTSRKPSTVVVEALEAQAEEEAAQLLRKRRPRQQSKREVEWIAKLVEKYGDNTGAMARDRRLNPMQQTEADIARRVRQWRGGRQDAPIVTEAETQA